MRCSTLSALAFVMVAVLCGGCASSEGPEEIMISSSQYVAAFEAAAEATRAEGMPPAPARRDLRAGIIETLPQDAASIVEPWRQDNASFEQALENTISHQRRRVRFEFAPVTASPPVLPGEQESPAGAPGLGAAPVDLTAYEGEIRLKAVVIVERLNRPGMRRSTWSRRLTSQTKLGGDDADLPGSFWTPVARDPAYERRLLAQIQSALEN